MPDNEQLGLPFGPPGTGIPTGNWSKAGPSYAQRRLLDDYTSSVNKLTEALGGLVKKVGSVMGMSGGSKIVNTGAGRDPSVFTDTTVKTSPGVHSASFGGSASGGGGNGGGFFSRVRRFGEDPDAHLGSLYAFQQGASALGSASMRVGGALDRTAQTGVNFQFSGYRLANRTGGSTLMETARLRRELTGYNGTADVMAGTNLLLNSMYRPNQSQFSSLLRGAGGISVLTGMGYSASAGVLAELGQSRVSNVLNMYGGGLTDRQGNIRPTGDALRSLASIALTGSSSSHMSVQALAKRGQTAFNLSGGNAANNLRALGLSDDVILAVNEYLQRSGKSGHFLSDNELTKLNVPGRAFQKTAEAQAKKESALYDKTSKSMADFQLQLQHLNNAMAGIPAGLANFGFWSGKATQGMLGLAQTAIQAMFILRAGNILKGLGGAAEGGGLLSAIGIGGMGSALLAGGAGALAGGGFGFLTAKATHQHGAAGALTGAAGGAAAGAMAGSVIPGLGTLAGGVIGGLAGAFGGMLGDPPGGGTSAPGTNGLSPDLAKRLSAMMQENPRLVVTSGKRSRAEQEALYKRYLAGGPLAAKPGTSQHEKGLAVDLGPSSEYGWLAANAARYGLVRTVSSEPWHFEPVGARTMGNLAATRAADEGSDVGGSLNVQALFLGGKFGSVSAAGSVARSMALGPNRGAPRLSGSGTSAATSTSGTWSSGTMTINDVAKLALSAGLPQGALATALAIAMAESRDDPNATHTNTNGSIDRGLWQINSVHGNQSTFDPLGNARAMVAISGGGKNWKPWSTYNNGMYKDYLSTVQQALASGVGDPASPVRSRGGMVLAPSKVVHIGAIHMPIQMPANSSDEEARKLAHKVLAMIDEDKTAMMMGER